MPLDYPSPIRELVLQMKTLPGLGPRSAERLVLWLMGPGTARAETLADSLTNLRLRVVACEECGFFLEREGECALCHDFRRNRRLLCVVEQAPDVMRLERSGAFTGLYHVLGGKLAPLDNVTPADLRIEELLRRVHDLSVGEVILALGADVEGEATAHYLAEALRPTGVPITRLAQGMPAGGGLEHADEMTLHHALSGRRAM
ncbi:MAG: recombination mediator RecR [Roseimicrobium sp.]